MKRNLIILISFLSISLAMAQEKTPMMATAIVKSLQETFSGPPQTYRCSSNNPWDVENKVDSFDATIHCEIQCKNGQSSKTQVDENFNPEFFGLKPGDGSSDEKVLWRSLGHTLSVWGDSICLEESQKFCQSKENIKNFKLEQMNSGTWSFKGKLNCQSKDFILSPFDKNQKLKNHLISKTAPKKLFADFSTYKKNHLQNILPEKMSEEEAKKLIHYEDDNNLSCDHKINIKSCFGDCVYLEEGQKEWTETLSTNEFYGDLNFSICADQFVQKIKNSNWSEDVNSSLCNKFAWEVIRLSDAPGTSCAAYRVEVDCSQL